MQPYPGSFPEAALSGMRDFQTRIAELMDYSMDELRAYQYFRVIALASVRVMRENQHVQLQQSGYRAAATLHIRYPSIDVANFITGSEGCQIVLAEDHSTIVLGEGEDDESKVEQKIVVPSLRVFSPGVELDPTLPEYDITPDEEYYRLDLPSMYAWDDGESSEFVRAFLADDNIASMDFSARVAQQNAYVKRLGQAAEALDLPHVYGEFLPLPMEFEQ